MKHLSLLTLATIVALSAYAESGSWLVSSQPTDESSSIVVQAPMREDAVMGCPSFPGIMYPSISYNVGAIPWRLEWTSANFGDLTGATIQWYRYKSREGETKAQAVPFTGKGSNTIDECYPATDEANSWYDYFCRITKPGCSTIESGIFDVQVGINDPCMTFVGTTFRMTSGDQRYNVGQSFTLSANTTAYGGDHQYTWYHNGEPIDTTDHTKYTLTWGFNTPTLRVNNATLQDGGTYSISMQDGTECFMYTDPVRITIGNVTCGTAPSIGAQKTGLGEGETTKIAVTNAVLAADETGEFVFMLQPEGSNPQITGTNLNNMTFTPDMAGTYNIKYVINNSTNASCFRESKVISIVVYACGPQPTISADIPLEPAPGVTALPMGTSVVFTGTGVGQFETGKMTYSQNGGAETDMTWSNNTLPTWVGGQIRVSYTITNSKVASCNRSASVDLYLYDCGSGNAYWKTYIPNKINIGQSVTVGATLPYTNPTGQLQATYSYTLDGGEPVSLSEGTFTPTEPGTYVISANFKHINPAVPDCGKAPLVATVTVAPCGTKATITSNKSSMKVGESATLTLAKPASGETATLTYSKNGGGAQSQTFSNTSATFTPTSAGTYVFTYTITVPGCGPNSATTTIEVYDCGPDATISAPTDTEVNKPIAVTVSNVGDHETGTLTYSKDGGAAQTIANPASWTPTAAGTYKLVWSVKHDKIDCTRSAETTVNVYGCGVPADIQSDKNILKIGESATFTLSAVSNLETSKITYTKDGGSAVDFTGTTFTPTEAGVYVFTYTVSHTKITCETSDQVTVTVYGCGPDAAITTAKNTYNTTETVDIQVSELGTNESGTLTYSKDGGAPVTISAGTWTPSGLGTYVLTWKVSHLYIDCAREATKTIKVSDCGDPADIEASKTVLKLGESATLTISEVTDEGATGAVTMTKDGGTATSYTGTTFSPTEEGEYTFRYVITNTMLDCQTEDEVTIEVYDCGPDATLAIEPMNIKLGDAAVIAASEVGDHETGVLTYSLNGGAPVSITAGNWTAPAVGTYELIWTVTHDKIDCQRSSTPVVVHVYDCGAAADIAADQTVIGIGQSVNFTLSAVADGSTGSITYTKDGGAPVPFTGTIFTPDNHGNYVFTYVVENALVGCYSEDQVTIEVHKELVFDDKNGTHVWSDVKNWWPAYSRIPNYEDSAIIRVPCNVDIADAQTGDLNLDVASGKSLTILPTGALTINNRLINYKAGDILVRADATGNGALVLAEGNIDIPATVEFYARSKDREELKTIWQYMGYPLNDKPTIATAYPQAVMYEWTNTPNPEKGGNWQRVDSLTGTVSPFSGYCMTEDKEQIYTFSGILNDPIKTAVEIPYNDQGQYPGFAFVANSWVAPIDIARMQVSDFGAADATVYIMNTGTYFEAAMEQKNISTTGMATARGQYNAIPIHAAPYLAGALSTIPPMQGFFVHTKAATTLQLDYPNAVFNAATHSSTVNPTRTPRRNLGGVIIPNVYRFKVNGFGEEDEIYILEANAFTNQFDNGWDGYKAKSEFSQVHMAVVSDNNELAVAAVPELDGTSFFFDGGNHKTYTMLMECSENIDGLMLWDMTKDTYTPLVSGSTFSFKCGATPENFMIINPNTQSQSREQVSEEDDRVEKFILNEVLYIRHRGRLYDACGRRINTHKWH